MRLNNSPLVPGRPWALAGLLWACAAPVTAAPVAWVNPGLGDWRTGANWAGGAVPGALDDARLLNGGTAVLAGGLAAVRSVEIGGAGAGSMLRLEGAPVTLQLLEGGLLVGRSFAGETQQGTLAAAAGRLQVSAPTTGAGSITVGRSNGGSARGSAVLGSVTAEGLATVAVGAARGGQAWGELSLLNGPLVVGEAMRVGDVDVETGGEATGRVVISGNLEGRRSGQSLDVGLATGGSTGLGPFQGRAQGELEAAALLDLQNVAVGTTATARADDVQAEGRLATGAIVNAGPAGAVQVGRSLGLARSVGGVPTITGAATAHGAAVLTGDLSGYNSLEVGTALFSGRAEGSLVVTGGDVSVGALRVGTTTGSTAFTVVDGALDASGQVSQRGGSLALGSGSSSVGAVFNPVPGLAARADGTVWLEDVALSGGLLAVGSGGGARGELTLRGAGGSATLRSLGLGLGEAASGTVRIESGSLRVDDADPIVGSITVGAQGGHARLLASDATIDVGGNLSVGGFTTAGGDGRVLLTRSTLNVAGGVGVGDTGAASIAELALVDSAASAGGLRLGAGGDARLVVDASSLFLSSALTMDAASSLWIGIDGLVAGVGGYGVVDLDTALLAGALHLDLTELDPALLPGAPTVHFDLLRSRRSTGLVGDFARVTVLGAPTGYGLSWGTVVEGGEIWRLTLTRLGDGGGGSVPLPSTPGLLLAAAVAAGFVRGRRRAH